jgi:hypothetical protein
MLDPVALAAPDEETAGKLAELPLITPALLKCPADSSSWRDTCPFRVACFPSFGALSVGRS